MLRCLRSKVRMTSVSAVAKVYTCLKFLYVKEDKETHAPPSYLKTIVMHTMQDKCLLATEKAGWGCSSVVESLPSMCAS